MNEGSSHDISTATHLGVFVALLILTGVMVWTATVNLHGWNTTLALGIAGVKGTLIILYLMHARFSSWLVRATIAGGFFFLIIMFGLTFADYVSRETVSPLPYLQ
jgi:cytochrome c oxidase subunit IV